MKEKTKIHNWWKIYIKKSLPIIKDWLKKENLYLQKNIERNRSVLDVGCGSGRHLKLLANITKEISGIDWDKEAVKEAKKNLSKFRNIKIFLEDAQEMHFKNNTFDYIICMGNTFGDFGTDKLKILKEMKRVIKIGGKIIISVYSEKALKTRLKQYEKIGIKIQKIENDGTVYTVYTPDWFLEQFSKEKLKDIFKRAGLVVKITELNPISYICEAVKK